MTECTYEQVKNYQCKNDTQEKYPDRGHWVL